MNVKTFDRRSVVIGGSTVAVVTFTIASSGDPGIVVQLIEGNFVGYDAVCPHAGCTVGPVPHGLMPHTIGEVANGNLYW